MFILIVTATSEFGNMTSWTAEFNSRAAAERAASRLAAQVYKQTNSKLKVMCVIVAKY